MVFLFLGLRIRRRRKILKITNLSGAHGISVPGHKWLKSTRLQCQLHHHTTLQAPDTREVIRYHRLTSKVLIQSQLLLNQDMHPVIMKELHQVTNLCQQMCLQQRMSIFEGTAQHATQEHLRTVALLLEFA